MIAWFKKYWIAIVLIGFLIAILDVTASSLATCHPPPEGSTEAIKAQYAKNCSYLHGPVLISLDRLINFIDKHNGFFVVLFTGVLAAFTAALWRSTDKMWDAGERQLALVDDNFKTQITENRKIAERNWSQMADSIAATLEAARAASGQALSAARQAEIAEKAFLKSERPYVLITNLSFIKPPKTTEELIITKPHVTYKVGNFGRVAALIHDIRHVFQVARSDRVPENPFSSDPPHRILAETIDAGYAIAAGEIIDKQWFALPDNAPCRENDGWLDPDLKGGQTVFMFVRVRYEDVSGPIRDRVDTWKYDFNTHQFLKCGGTDHNYEREV